MRVRQCRCRSVRVLDTRRSLLQCPYSCLHSLTLLLLQSLDQFAPRKGTLMFGRKGSGSAEDGVGGGAGGAGAGVGMPESDGGDPGGTTLHEGMLLRQNKLGWKKRFCRLRADTFETFASAESTESQETFSLDACTFEEAPGRVEKPKPHMLALTHGENRVLFAAKDEVALSVWVQHLREYMDGDDDFD